jgi:hypothetical protein
MPSKVELKSVEICAGGGFELYSVEITTSYGLELYSVEISHETGTAELDRTFNRLLNGQFNGGFN